MSLDRLLSRLHLLSGLVITRSVLNPLLWLVAVVAPVSVVAAVATTGAYDTYCSRWRLCPWLPSWSRMPISPRLRQAGFNRKSIN